MSCGCDQGRDNALRALAAVHDDLAPIAQRLEGVPLALGSQRNLGTAVKLIRSIIRLELKAAGVNDAGSN